MQKEDERDKRDAKKARQSRVLANTKHNGKEKTAAAVMGSMFVKFGPDAQDKVAALYLTNIRQDHFREEVVAALVPLGVKLFPNTETVFSDKA